MPIDNFDLNDGTTVGYLDDSNNLHITSTLASLTNEQLVMLHDALSEILDSIDTPNPMICFSPQIQAEIRTESQKTSLADFIDGLNDFARGREDAATGTPATPFGSAHGGVGAGEGGGGGHPDGGGPR